MTVMPVIQTDAEGLSSYPMMRFKTDFIACEGKPSCWHRCDPGVLISALLGEKDGPHGWECMKGGRPGTCEHMMTGGYA